MDVYFYLILVSFYIHLNIDLFVSIIKKIHFSWRIQNSSHQFASPIWLYFQWDFFLRFYCLWISSSITTLVHSWTLKISSIFHLIKTLISINIYAFFYILIIVSFVFEPLLNCSWLNFNKRYSTIISHYLLTFVKILFKN